VKRTVTLTREFEFDVVVECNRSDNGEGWEYSVEDEPSVVIEELGVNIRADWWVHGRAEVVLTKGEVKEAIDLAIEES
jgi:hypothetical protein